MKLKTYTAGTMAEALTQVKRDLGPHAVIIRTRVYKAGGVMGVGGRQVVEIIASDGTPEERPRRATSPARDAFIPAAYQAAGASKGIAPAVPAAASVGVATADPPLSPPARPPTRPHVASPVRVETPEPDDRESMRALRDDLAAIKSMVGRVLARESVTNAPAESFPGALGDLHATLLREGLGDDLAREAARAAASVGGVAADPDRARRAMLAALESFVPAVGQATPAGRRPDGRPLTIALVGPTGVGKTTTIAKLGAWYKLKGGARVGMVTCDTYRIAAVEQLRTYATIIGVPLRVALTPREVGEAVDALADLDVVILDTPGRSQHDGTRLEELRACVAAARAHETHLVLSAAASPGVLERAGKAFGSLGADRLVVTKVDEAVQFGPVARLVRGSGLRVSYLTTGQEVPDQIELASPARMAAMLLDGPGGGVGGGGGAL
jgi:flagellar biosynthesis protein FlhF